IQLRLEFGVSAEVPHEGDATSICMLLQCSCIKTYDDQVMTTRERLLATAEELYGGLGIDAVSLREIQRASGVKNGNARQYHFRDRNGLLTALLEKHSHDVELRRHALLDRYEAGNEQDLRALAEALVMPLAAKLAESESGSAYLCIYADLINRRQPIFPP